MAIAHALSDHLDGEIRIEEKVACLRHPMLSQHLKDCRPKEGFEVLLELELVRPDVMRKFDKRWRIDHPVKKDLPSLPQWAGDIGRLSAVIAAEVYLPLSVALIIAMGGIASARRRLRIQRVDLRKVRFAAALWVGAYVVAFAMYYILTAVLPAFPSPSELARFLAFIGTDMGRLNGADTATWIIVVVRACVLAPIGEELLFRGALFGWLRDHLSAWQTIGLTALAFAIHGFASTMVPLAFVVGLAAGYARERAASATPLIAAHVLQNTVVVLAGVWSMQ